jgi:hypothetical protein
MKTFKELLGEAKKLFVFASWENGVLKWRTDKADDRTGSDPMKKKPSEADVKKHLEKVLGTKVDLDFRIDESAGGTLDEAMSKKDFIAFAAMIKSSKTLEDMVDKMVEHFKGENPAFDVERFKKAAGM